MRIWYHGTVEENVESILRDGFKSGTWFAKNLADALCMGGPFVFGVVLPIADDFPDWQCCFAPTVPASRIAHLRHFADVKVLYHNAEVGFELHCANSPHPPCPRCRGFGELNYPDDGHDLLPYSKDRDAHTPERELCPMCRGYGSVERYHKMQG